MSNTIQLDPNFSTTRHITTEKPLIPHSPVDKFEPLLFLHKDQYSKHEGGLRTQGYFKKGYENKPLLSVITIVYNGEQFLENTIQSVINQTYDNVEYIIIDGGSKDKTVEIIRKYENKIDYWISEQDRGIGDAWNKGIRVSLGSFILLLNADDTFYENSSLQDLLSKNTLSENAIMYGNTQYIKEDSSCGGYVNGAHNPDRLKYGFGFMHTSCIVPKALYSQLGLFSIDYKIAVDTEWLIRAVINNVPFNKINYCNIMRTGGVSDTNRKAAYYEYLAILKQYDIIKNSFFLKQKFNLKACLSPLKRFKLQVHFILLRLFNSIINLVPFFILKKKLLKYLFAIDIGENSYIHGNIRFFGFQKITVKDNSTINFGCYLDNRNEIYIGHNVSIAHNVKIYTLGHDVNDPCFNTRGGAVTIGDNVCIFSNVLIMPNVTIGEGAVVYPGSVVTKDVSPFEIYGGNPAKKIGVRNTKINYTIDYGYWFAN